MATSFAPELPVEGKTVKALTSLAAKRTRELFAGNFGESLPLDVQRWVATAQQAQARTGKAITRSNNLQQVPLQVVCPLP